MRSSASRSLIASDLHFPQPPKNSIKLSDLESVARKLAFAPPGQRDQLAKWLRSGSPLARRMHRNTRTTLRQYYQMKLLPDPPPKRSVDDILFDYVDPEERKIYNDLGKYIQKRFEELENEKPGKGFVMTIYRRRASSSPQALERSLERRRKGLLSLVDKRAYSFDLELGDVPEALDADDLPEGLEGGKISTALPQDPKAAQSELNELKTLLERLRALNGRDSKREEFFRQLRTLTDDGRPALVFTEYTDTLEYLKDSLTSHYGKALGCYSGDGGQLLEGDEWKTVSKDSITRALREGRLRVLLCTDAASEGLNLQAAGALINYDLPWNPSRVEQRIGRIDRIGQKNEVIYVVNLFLRDSVDDQVYRALRQRCGLFETFVGAMQPVLARARRMLLGQDPIDPSTLRRTASELENDPLAEETYVESSANSIPLVQPAVNREEMRQELLKLDGAFGPKATDRKGNGVIELSLPGNARVAFSTRIETLEKDKTVIPLSPMADSVRQLAEGLQRPGERLPLVVGASQKGSFRRAVVVWIQSDRPLSIRSLSELLLLTNAWNGEYPNPERWNTALADAQRTAEAEVDSMCATAKEREEEGLRSQIEAARLRLMGELGRYLVCFGDSGDLNHTLQEQANRDTATAARLSECLQRLGGYPPWTPELVRELKEFGKDLTENKRRGRLLGRELEAALQDPRWSSAASF